MNTGENATRLRIYVSSTDKHEHIPLYEHIVLSAKKSGIAGATVLKGIMGYGSSSEVYSEKLWELSEKVPLVVEIIDTPDKIYSFFESIKHSIEGSGKGHIVTSDSTSVLLHKAGGKA